MSHYEYLVRDVASEYLFDHYPTRNADHRVQTFTDAASSRLKSGPHLHIFVRTMRQGESAVPAQRRERFCLTCRHGGLSRPIWTSNQDTIRGDGCLFSPGCDVSNIRKRTPYSRRVRGDAGDCIELGNHETYVRHVLNLSLAVQETGRSRQYLPSRLEFPPRGGHTRGPPCRNQLDS